MAESTIEQVEQHESTRNTKKVLMFFVSVILLGVVAFCEILYVSIIINAFPDGLIRLFAIVGACATGASALALLVGKLHWFSKGPQSVAAWVFVGMETLIMALNVLLAIQLHNGGHLDAAMQVWSQFYPAAPVVAFVGWGLILYLDKDNRMRAMKRGQREREEQAELDYEALVHATRMQVKRGAIKTLEAYLQDELSNPNTLDELRGIAASMRAGILSEISGKPVRLPPTISKIVDGNGHAVHAGDTSPLDMGQVNGTRHLAQDSK